MAESNIRLPEPVKKPADWKRFKDAFQFYITASETEKKSDQVKIALLINCIGEEHIDTFNTFELSSSATLDSVIEKFNGHFEPQLNVVYERYKFRTRKQQDGEPIATYITALKSLALTCSYNDKDDQIRNTLVCGIRDPTSVEKLLREPKLTLKRTEEFLHAKEISETQTKHIKSDSSSTSTSIVADSVVKATSSRSYKNNYSKPSRSNCSRCGTQHAPRKCPAFGKSCTFCDIPHHFASVCRAKLADEGQPGYKNSSHVNQHSTQVNFRKGQSHNLHNVEIDRDLSSIRLDSLQLHSDSLSPLARIHSQNAMNLGLRHFS